jgi:hypothetical protein
MECMRALIENDRQVEGCFTTYSPVLERAALKRDRFLKGEPAAEPQPPQAPPAERAPPPESPFADKLKRALQPASNGQES